MTQLSPAALTDPGRQRDHNEDAFWVPSADWPAPEQIVARGALYIVADGMGGHLAGEVASGMAADLIPHAYYADPDRDVAASLRRAIEAANAEVFRAAQEHPARAKMGATLVAAALRGNRLTVAHAGDSRVYLLRGERLHRLTEDHSWVNERLQAGVLTPEEAASHPLRNVVTRALGDKEEIEPEINTCMVEPGDTVLLCTDGLWEPVGDQEIARILTTQPPQQAVQSLIGAANEAGGPDNITAVVIPVEKKKPAASRAPLITAGALVGLVVVGLLCALSVRRMGMTLFPTSTPTATATITPTPTPMPTPTPTPLPPDTSVGFGDLGKPIEYLPGDQETLDGFMRTFKVSQQQLVRMWLNQTMPWFSLSDEALCLQPRRPYGVILVGQVTLPITSDTALQVQVADLTYTVTWWESPIFASDSTLVDQQAIWVRVFGVAEDATTIRALWLDGSEVGKTEWQPLSRAVPGRQWRGWFYARANSEATAGLEGLEDTSWGKDAVIVAYLELNPSADPGLDVDILRGPYSLGEVACRLLN